MNYPVSSISQIIFLKKGYILTLLQNTNDFNILIKIKETEHQANIKERKDRLKNLSGSFSVKNAEMIKSRNIILIDDVITTGATLSEARKTLKQFGAKKIIAFTVAH